MLYFLEPLAIFIIYFIVVLTINKLSTAYYLNKLNKELKKKREEDLAIYLQKIGEISKEQQLLLDSIHDEFLEKMKRLDPEIEEQEKRYRALLKSKLN